MAKTKLGGWLVALFTSLTIIGCRDEPVPASANHQDAEVQASFWEFIHKAKTEGGNSQRLFAQSLRAQLEPLPTERIQEFDSWLSGLIRESYSWELWGAAYVINGGCGDDSFDYFRGWLVSQGKDIYETALANPDDLADLHLSIDPSEGPTFEGLAYIALDVYEKKTGLEMPYSPSSILDGPTGEPWDESELGRLFPKLSAKY